MLIKNTFWSTYDYAKGKGRLTKSPLDKITFEKKTNNAKGYGDQMALGLRRIFKGHFGIKNMALSKENNEYTSKVLMIMLKGMVTKWP